MNKCEYCNNKQGPHGKDDSKRHACNTCDNGSKFELRKHMHPKTFYEYHKWLAMKDEDYMTKDTAACIIDNFIHKIRRRMSISARGSSTTLHSFENVLQTIDLINALEMAKEALMEGPEGCTDVLLYDEDDAAEFINAETGIDMSVIEKVINAEMKYMESIGIAYKEGEVIEKIAELKPCPLCGRGVNMTEFMVRHCDDYAEFSAKIECSCGLSFEKEWITGVGVIFDDSIITVWNERKG